LLAQAALACPPLGDACELLAPRAINQQPENKTLISA
jgi:hypothetical protein